MIGDKECLNCGQELALLPGKRVKVFCNSTCRSNYWQKADRLEKAGKTDEEVVKILSQITKNNKPKNKKRIEKERNTVAVISAKIQNPLTESQMIRPPRTLDELKALCPKELTGFEKSQWIGTKRQEYGI